MASLSASRIHEAATLSADEAVKLVPSLSRAWPPPANPRVASPPPASRIAFRLSNMATPYFSTAAAFTTYSLSDSQAGMSSEVVVPGPLIRPPSALCVGLAD